MFCNKKTKNMKDATINNAIKEGLIVLLMVVLVIAGIVIDSRHIVLKIIDDISSTFLTILQIQSSIATVSIAIISLLSNVISEEYYGIAASNYYLNIKPSLFKQKFIVISSIFFIVLNAFLHFFNFYNTMMCIFIVSCIFIIISINEIYTAFNGRKTISNEINKYISDVFFNSKFSYESKIEVFINYLRTWPNLIENKVDYDNEIERYKKVLPELLKMNESETLKVIQKETSVVIKRLVYMNDKAIKYRGFELFASTLFVVWNYIENNKFKHIYTDFDLYSECDCEIVQCLKDLPYDNFKTVMNWERLVDVISKLCIFCHSDKESDVDSLNRHSKQLIEIPIYYARILSNKLRNLTVNIENNNNVSYLPPNLDLHNDAANLYLKIARQCKFAYFSTLLSNNQIEILLKRHKKYPIFYSLNKNNNTILSMIVICYTYYIFAYESSACVTELEKNDAKKVIARIKEDGTLMESIFTMLSDTSIVLTDLTEELKNTLEYSEKMPLDGSSKICIINDAINDFIILLGVLLYAYNRDEKIEILLLNNMPASSWCLQYFGENRDKTICKINNMLDDLINEENQVIGDSIERCVSELEIKLLRLYKNEILEKANETQKSFDEVNKNNCLVNKLQEQLKNELNQRFEGCIGNIDNNYHEVKFTLTQFDTSPDLLQKCGLYYAISKIEFEFLRSTGMYFAENGNLKLFERSKDNDGIYFSILDGKELLLVGPEHVLCNPQKEQKNNFELVSSKCTKINTKIGNVGLVLTNKLPIFIYDITISRIAPTLNDIEYYYDATADTYKYSPSHGIVLEYTKNELKYFLENEKLVFKVELTLKVSDVLLNYGYCIYRKIE